MRLVDEATHRADERRETGPLDTELLAVLDPRDDGLIDSGTILEIALRPAEPPPPRRDQRSG